MYNRAHRLALACGLATLAVAVCGAATPQARPSRVAGRMTTHDGRKLVSATVSMRPVRTEGADASSPQDVTVLPDGAFMFRDIAAGEYLIRARGDVDRRSPARFATFRVRVEGRDIDGVELPLIPGAEIEGRVVMEAGADSTRRKALFKGLRVRAPLNDDGTFGDALTGDVQRDGSYAIRGVMPGTHTIVVEGLPDRWNVTGVTWRGRDITAQGLDAESGQVYADVRVTIAGPSGNMVLSPSR